MPLPFPLFVLRVQHTWTLAPNVRLETPETFSLSLRGFLPSRAAAGMSHTCGQSVKCNKLNRTAPRGLLPNRPLLVKANVEILYFESCPIWQETQAPVERVASDLPIELDLRLVELADANATVEHRFLGSPSVRANGSDVEPGAATRA
jgi:hypothetical protein